MYEQQQTSANEYLLGKAVEVRPEESDIKKVPHTRRARLHRGPHRDCPATAQ